MTRQMHGAMVNIMENRTIYGTRRRNLETLITEAGSVANLADRADTNPSYLSQIRCKRKNPKSTKVRQVGDTLARKLERGMNKPLGWMDSPHIVVVNTGKRGRVANNQESLTDYPPIEILSLDPQARQIAEAWSELPDVQRHIVWCLVFSMLAAKMDNERLATITEVACITIDDEEKRAQIAQEILDAVTAVA